MKTIASTTSRLAGRLATIAAALLAAGGIAYADAAVSRAQLAELAEQAALAGAAVLAGAGQSADEDASIYAIKVAQDVVARRPGIEAQVFHSAEQRSVTVKLLARHPGRYPTGTGATLINANATAHYAVAEQPTNWAWAPRQHFAARVQGWRQAQAPNPFGSR